MKKGPIADCRRGAVNPWNVKFSIQYMPFSVIEGGNLGSPGSCPRGIKEKKQGWDVPRRNGAHLSDTQAHLEEGELKIPARTIYKIRKRSKCSLI